MKVAEDGEEQTVRKSSEMDGMFSVYPDIC